MSDQMVSLRRPLPPSAPAIPASPAPVSPAATRTKLLLEGPDRAHVAAPGGAEHPLTLLAFAGVITFDGFFLGRIGTNCARRRLARCFLGDDGPCRRPAEVRPSRGRPGERRALGAGRGATALLPSDFPTHFSSALAVSRCSPPPRSPPAGAPFTLLGTGGLPRYVCLLRRSRYGEDRPGSAAPSGSGRPTAVQMRRLRHRRT